MSCIYLGETKSRPAPLNAEVFAARYSITRQGFFWIVQCGNSERVIHKSLFRYTAQRFAAELNSAFLDGQFLGRFKTLPLNR